MCILHPTSSDLTLFVLYQTALHHAWSRESNAFVRKNWTDKTTRLIPLNPSVGQCLVFGMEPPTRCGGPPFASLSNWQ
jgi:hypothetical protein